MKDDDVSGDRREEPAIDARVVRTRAKVLDAARAMLLAEGLDAITHLRVAEAAGVGRKTVYRHWPDRASLLRAVLSTADYPRAPVTGALRADLIAHLRQLRRALVDGPLAVVMLALLQRASVDPGMRQVREQLTAEGFAPLRAILETAIARGELPTTLDLEAAAAALEGPIFYRVLIAGEALPAAAIAPIADAFLAAHAPVTREATRPPRTRRGGTARGAAGGTSGGGPPRRQRR